MRQFPTLLSAFALGLAAFAGTAQAAPRSGAFASLVTPLLQPKQEIVSGVLWKCDGEHCAAASDGSRPLLVCQRVAKAFGQVARFSTPAGELSSEDISRCNGGT
ncbi:hypothetical protein KRR38_25680 [Novosphingobium sp. G106]|uniref:CC_3452 family protein n=1 Tax=Novosphingobium sp. G106 TaxID=2849500 RepID=UPI001C2D458F|nr:hypothetical protein [Novosphingobium sp. G106]MBV1690976.1 hypothetical protein [Novosphingobium sp. G106]